MKLHKYVGQRRLPASIMRIGMYALNEGAS